MSFNLILVYLRMRYVSFSLFFLLVFLLSHHGEAAMTQAQIKQAMKTVRNMCIPKSGVTKDAVNKLQSGEFDEADTKVQCYLSCALGMMQAIKNNKITLSFLKTQVSKMLAPDVGAKIMATFESCQSVEGTDNCNLAFNFAKCVYETDKDSYLIP